MNLVDFHIANFSSCSTSPFSLPDEHQRGVWNLFVDRLEALSHLSLQSELNSHLLLLTFSSESSSSFRRQQRPPRTSKLHTLTLHPPYKHTMSASGQSQQGNLDRYVVIHVATTCDEHGVYVTKDSAEVIELGWILLDAKTCDEVSSHHSHPSKKQSTHSISVAAP